MRDKQKVITDRFKVCFGYHISSFTYSELILLTNCERLLTFIVLQSVVEISFQKLYDLR